MGGHSAISLKTLGVLTGTAGGMAHATEKAMRKIIGSEPDPHEMSENHNQSLVPRGVPDKQMPTRHHAGTQRSGSPHGWNVFLGVLCLGMIGMGFLLLETGDRVFFVSCGAASCVVGIAASGLRAYFGGHRGVMCSLLFALPVLLVGVVARIGLAPGGGLALDMWCAFGVLMFVASYAGGLAGEVYGKKRLPKKTT